MDSKSSDPQFDSFLGGSEVLPNTQNLSEYIKRRMEEVVMLTEAIDESPFRGQAFQRLPKHMRRRQMSHHIKRLPRRLQRPYLMSLKDGLPTPTKKPSRKYRRKPSNLLLEYNRRQKSSIWLETHIWHAKRFHMTKNWGYKLPERPVNKNFKACYRAMSEHCLLIDESYYNCMELEGPESELCDGLKQCTSPECGLTFCAKMYLSGQREGHTTIFHPNSYPHKVIGGIRFMWQPGREVDGRRKLWIWVHPLSYDEVIGCFNLLFGLSAVEAKTEEPDDVIIVEEPVPPKKKFKKLKEKIEIVKLEPKNVPFVRTPKYTNQSITMTSLKDTLNRFQLTGPLSHAVVTQAFTVASIDTPDIEILEVKRKRRKTEAGEEEEVGERNWWEKYYEESSQRRAWASQKAFLEKMTECCRATDLPSGMILGLVIEDPRLKIPSKREKATPRVPSGGDVLLEGLPLEGGLSESPIWMAEVRDEVSAKKLTTEEINKARSKKIVPGLDVKGVIADEKQSRIPILLVQRPGRGELRAGKLGLGSGWDVIAPAGFGMPIWLSLIFRGARTGGLRESKLLALECGSVNGWPPPDSAAGETDSLQNLEKLRKQYFKMPPNKRANFIKLGVLSPFYPPWKVLVRDWIRKKDAETVKLENLQFSVLRDYKTLNALEDVLNGFPKWGSDEPKALNLNRNCLVPVLVECCGRGRPRDLALLTLPHDEDLKDLTKGPTEPSHADENEKWRKTLKDEHAALLKSLKRKRRKERTKLKEEFANGLPGGLTWKEILRSNAAPSEAHSKEYNARMEGLWLPEVEKLESVVDGCSRSIVGYVLWGEYSYSRARGLGLGYVTAPGLLRVLEVCERNRSEVVALVRNVNEVQYRFGRLKVGTSIVS